MLKLAKILNYKGFHITFVNTEYNQRRLLKSRGADSLKGLPSTIEWLDSKKPNSVDYVNFGSIAVMTANQLIEFAWGLQETKERGMLTSWCPQEQVLSHPTVGGFLI